MIDFLEELFETVAELVSKFFSFLLRYTYIFIPIIVLVLLYYVYSLGNLPRSIGGITNSGRNISHIMVLALVSGIAAMAVVQFWKLMLRPRARFHLKFLRDKIGGNANQLLSLVSPGFLTEIEIHQSAKLDDEIISKDRPTRLGIYRDDGLAELLDSPAEILVSKISSAVDFVIINPEKYQLLLRSLVGYPGQAAVSRYLEYRHARERESADRASEALVTIRQLVEQNLDLMLVQLHQTWRRRVRLSALISAGTIGLITALLSGVSLKEKGVIFGVLIFSSIWGGFFAWFSRDVIASIERLRD